MFWKENKKMTPEQACQDQKKIVEKQLKQMALYPYVYSHLRERYIIIFRRYGYKYEKAS